MPSQLAGRAHGNFEDAGSSVEEHPNKTEDSKNNNTQNLKEFIVGTLSSQKDESQGVFGHIKSQKNTLKFL